MIAITTHILLHYFLFQLRVCYKSKFITIKFSKMMHHEVLSKEEFFSEFYSDTLIIQITYILVSQKMIVLQISSDSDNVNIRPTKTKKT